MFGKLTLDAIPYHEPIIMIGDRLLPAQGGSHGRPVPVAKLTHYDRAWGLAVSCQVSGPVRIRTERLTRSSA